MKSLLCLMMTALITATAFSQSGTLDITFGDKGFVSGALFGYHKAIVQQPDGKLLTAGGNLDADFNNKGNIIRFLTDGTIDSTFGNNGFSDITPRSELFDIALQPDGKILVVGAKVIGADINNYSYVSRFQSNGLPDSSFGENGMAFIPETHIYDSYTKVKLNADGSIIVAGGGLTNDLQTSYSLISRLSPNGTFDTQFGTNGWVINYTNKSDIYETGLAIQKDGKILLAGHTLAGGDDGEDYVLSRYNTDGTLDDGFGNHGNVITQGMQGLSGHDAPGDILVQPDGKIVLGGTTSGYNFIIYMAALRYNTDGSLDETFGNGGRTLVAFDGKRAQTYAVLLQPDGKIILSGSAGNSTESDFALCRLDGDGSLDSSFATNGKQTTLYEGGRATAYCATLQTDGKIVQGGSYENEEEGYESYLLARYNNDISRRQQIITRIRRWLQHHGITWQGDNNVRYYTVQRSTDGGVTYQPVAKLYNNQSSLSYEEPTTNNNALYRVAATGKDGSRSLSNSIPINNEASVKLFPNPVRSTLQLQGLPTEGISSITVTDFSGNVRTSTRASGTNASINASSLKPGNYLLKVQSGSTITTQTFVKQ